MDKVALPNQIFWPSTPLIRSATRSHQNLQHIDTCENHPEMFIFDCCQYNLTFSWVKYGKIAPRVIHHMILLDHLLVAPMTPFDGAKKSIYHNDVINGRM